MIGKRGNIFTENTLSIIIAVLCLLVIGYAAFNLYQTGVQESKNAQTVLDTVIVRANALEDGQSITTTIQGFKEADEWYLVGWSKDNPSKPEKCYNDYENGCLCICKGGGSNSSCQDEGICKEVEKDNVLVHTDPFEATIFYPGAAMSHGSVEERYEHRACIPLLTNLIEINIKKERGLAISYSFTKSHLAISYSTSKDPIRERYDRIRSCEALSGDVMDFN